MGPIVPEAHVAVGNLWLVRGQAAKARAAYEAALRIDPTSAAAQHGLARVAQRTGGLSRAARLLIGLIRVDPTGQQYADDLRDVLIVALVFAALASMVAALLAAPAGLDDPSPQRLAIALAVCLLAQGGTALGIRRVVGPAALPLLLSRRSGDRRRAWALRVTGMSLLAGDALLLVGLIAGQWAAALTHGALVAFLVAALAVPIGLIRR